MEEQETSMGEAASALQTWRSSITVPIIQKVAEILKVDLLTLIAVPPGSFLESRNDSPGAIVDNKNIQLLSG